MTERLILFSLLTFFQAFFLFFFFNLSFSVSSKSYAEV